MIKIEPNIPTFKYLYNSDEFIGCGIEHFNKFNDSEEDLSILKDFNNFLTLYHRIPEKEVIDLFNKKISNQIKFLCVKAIIDSSVDEATDEEVVDYFGALVYVLIKDLCLDYEYPEERAEKYANLYRNAYKNDISYFL
jgi:hypothetical protein